MARALLVLWECFPKVVIAFARFVKLGSKSAGLSPLEGLLRSAMLLLPGTHTWQYFEGSVFCSVAGTAQFEDLHGENAPRPTEPQLGTADALPASALPGYIQPGTHSQCMQHIPAAGAQGFNVFLNTTAEAVCYRGKVVVKVICGWEHLMCDHAAQFKANDLEVTIGMKLQHRGERVGGMIVRRHDD